MSSHDNAASLDWAEDSDDEIDFSAPVFSDDEDLPASLTTGIVPSPVSPNTSQPSQVTASTSSAASTSSSHRYTAGFADGSGHSLDRKSHNGSSLHPSGGRRLDDVSSSRPMREQLHPEQPRGYSSSRRGTGGAAEHYQGGTSYGSPNKHGSQRDHAPQRSGTPRQVIPLPPKPAAALDANSMVNRAKDRSRSPSYRSHSPQPRNDRPWESQSRQQHGRSPSPNPAIRKHQQQVHSLDHGPRSYSPGRHQSRAHMDQVMSTMTHSNHNSNNRNASRENRSTNRRSRELSGSDGRWEKTLQEDKPYPPLHKTQHHNNSNSSHNSHRTGSLPKDDVIYFKRRDGHPHDQSFEKTDTTTTGRMHLDRLEVTNSTGHNSHKANQGADSDRWQKVRQDDDLPYPAQSRQSTPSAVKFNNPPSHTRARSHGQTEANLTVPAAGERPVGAPSLRHERGGRGKGGKDQKRKSKDNMEPDETTTNDVEQQSDVPWWEQSTYAKKSTKEISKESSKESSGESSKETSKATETTAGSQELPWWEQATYKIQPKKTAEPTPPASTTEVTSKMNNVSLNPTTPSRQRTETDIMAKRKALDQMKAASGVEALTLVSRGGEDSGASLSIKDREVQEQVFSEIKTMIAEYENKYGSNKLRPIPPRTRQADEIDKIVESFRKLREGLFATESKDLFACQVYEQSVLTSLYAHNIPELTKALHQLVHELHPVYYGCSETRVPHGLDPDFNNIPAERQRFLGLYILYSTAKPNLPPIASSIQNLSLLSQSISCPRTETDQLIGRLVHLFDCHCLRARGGKTSSPALDELPVRLGPDLLFALTYWKALRDGNWIVRERLLSQNASVQPYPLSWEQRLILQRSMGDNLSAARQQTVSCMNKAFYSLPIMVMAQSVGLSSSHENDAPEAVRQSKNEELIKTLQASFGLRSNIIVRDDHILFKAKS
ncbi:hypothetical protein BGZ94_000421 [Podila epigama]|nr:hypothetical protein BGZ94_000421 [Podila epigama]